MRRGCGQDHVVLSAARSGDWNPALRAHAAACPSCQDALLVASGLRALSSAPEEGPLPEPGLLLRKAHLLERLQARQADLDRANRPLDMAAALSLAGAGLLVWSGWSLAPVLAVLAILGGLRVVGAAE